MDDESTPLEDSLSTFGELIAEGKVRHIAASNYAAPRLAAALELGRGGELPAYVALQPGYNLLDRTEYEGPLEELHTNAHEILGQILTQAMTPAEFTKFVADEFARWKPVAQQIGLKPN
jgi:aryl-alcohol dehydrogenase-like predicted oxidoreductase